jgi:hypothetical protein
VVASKIHFTKTIEDLSVYIPKSNILKELGGDEDWTYEYVEPVAGEDKLLSDNEAKASVLEKRAALSKAYEEATVKWIEAKQLTPDISNSRDDLAKQLAANYWELDPYVRSRTFYDRTGVISKGGHVEFYPNRGTSQK